MKNAIALQLKISPREWRTAILFIMLAYIPMFGQNSMDQHGNAKPQSLSKDQIEFNERLDAFVDSCMKDQKLEDQYSEQRHTCSAHKEVDITSLAMEEARHQFIVQNIEEYKQLFMGAEQSVNIMDICVNGGFEDDFLYYEGFTSTYTFGSDSCSPHNSFGPSFFVPATLPTPRRLEIVSSGTDPLVGINRTRFGNKALRLNHRYSHLPNENQRCNGSLGVDRISRKFIVTNENRIFTVWYAAVLENPSNDPHYNTQPFLNIRCDLAPQDELCFTADFLFCENRYTDSLNICVFDSLDVLNWTCHRFRIPSAYIGDTATLEITMADCEQGAHMGYVYIDGICEDCEGSALGAIIVDSIDYMVDCEGDVARICGRYSAPTVCNQNWWLDSIWTDGYTLTNFTLDTVYKTFCFDFPITNFIGQDTCLEFFITGRFANGTMYLPFQTSNEIDVCWNYYFNPVIDIQVGGCKSNTPVGETPNNNISDDYYYVYVEIDNITGLDWNILRTLTDPYPNEQDTREIAKGTGNVMLELGPFKIQEGGWLLYLYIMDTCEYVQYIDPPAYCSGCSAFYNAKIGNVQCNPLNNTWSFDIEVPSETSGSYDLSGTSYNFNEIYTIADLTIEEGCLKYTLEGEIDCESEFIICPPKPCYFNCNLEVYVEDVPCTKDEHGTITYYVNLDVEWPPSKYACYEATDVDGNSLDDGPLPLNQQLGPFEEDIYLTIKVCNSSCSSTANCPCYKTIYVPKPDCNLGGSRQFSLTSETEHLSRAIVSVQPNPTHSDEIIIYSNLPRTEYEILNLHGTRIISAVFIGKEHRQSLLVPPGIYFLKYSDFNGHASVIKIIKQ